MKTLAIQVEEHLYEALLALLREFPEDKVHILDRPAESAPLDFDQASDIALKKNAELYRRLA